jgi:hypothetical protein
MNTEFCVSELPGDAIGQLLWSEKDELSAVEYRALEHFVHQIGGFDNALLAAHLLSEIEHRPRQTRRWN